MRRRKLIAAAVTVLSLVAAAPAGADTGGVPNAAGDCGLGVPLAFTGINDPTLPGASDFATIPPNSVGCTGKP
jgi:hypothetical protein